MSSGGFLGRFRLCADYFLFADKPSRIADSLCCHPIAALLKNSKVETTFE